MKKYYGNYGTNGYYKGFYTSDVWELKNIPVPFIELTKQEWLDAIETRCKVVNGLHTKEPLTATETEVRDKSVIRAKRNHLLKQSDWTQLLNSPISANKQAEWATYRQQLRDITKTKPYIFPTKPK